MTGGSKDDWLRWLAPHEDSFEPFPLSQAQYGMWFAQQLDPDVPVVIAQYMDFNGEVDVQLLERSIDQARCEIGSGALKIVLDEHGDPLQRIDLGDHRYIDYHDFRAEPDPFAAALAWMHDEYSSPIDPLKGPLGNSAFLQVEDHRYLWYGRIHHIALDGFSAARWVSRSAELYTCAIEGTEPPAPRFASLRSLYEADVQYRNSSRYAIDRDFWIERLSGWGVISSLVEGSAQAVPRTKLETAPISPGMAERLENSDQSFGVSAALVLISAFALYLSRATGERDVTVSTTMLGRINRQQRESGGTFANIVPLRVSIDPGSTLDDLFKTVFREQIGALKHQRFSVEQIRHEIGLGESERRLLGPIVNPMLFDQNITFGDVSGEFNILTSGPVEDLLVNIYPRGRTGRTHVDFRANPGLYSDELLAEQHGRFMAFLEDFLSSTPERALGDIHPETAELGRAMERRRDAEKFWSRALDGLPEALDVPGAQAGEGPSTATLALATTAEQLRERGQDAEHVLMAAVAATLARLTGEPDIAITTVAAPEGNPAVIRLAVDTARSFDELAEQARSRAAAALEHATLDAASLANAVGAARVPGHAFLAVRATESAPLDLSAFDPSAFDPSAFDSRAEIAIVVDLAGAGPKLTVTAPASSDTVRGIAGRIDTMLARCLAAPSKAVGDHSMLVEGEHEMLVPVEGPASSTTRTLGELFTEVAATNSEVLAVIAGDQALTYRELDARANQVARYLIATAGTRAEQLVALGISRSVESILSTWAITKTGAGFVPVDPNYPKDRVEHMLDDSGAIVGVTVAAQRASLPDTIDWVVLDDPIVSAAIDQYPSGPLAPTELAAPVRLDSVAYVIYTSGSTGKPKGVAVTHHGLESYAAEERDAFDVTPGSRIMAFSSPSFDASLLEILFSLGNGVTMVIIPTTVYGGDDLRELLLKHQVTHAFITPLALASVEPSGVDDLRVIAVGGEALPRDLLQAWSPGRVFHNIYGPTETTIVTAISEPLRPDDPISIGGPIRGTRMVILDDRLQPVPMGVPGELYITGLGLARGYHERFDLTSNRFVADPYGPAGARMYRSGDLAQWARAPRTGNLTIEYVGRSDFQVKVRGFRIELGEIDTVLANHPAIAFAATLGVTGPNGETALVAYVKPEEGQDPTTDELLDHLGEFLPAHMVPSLIIPISEIPLNPVGKLDRKALPEPDFTGTGRTATFAAPTNPVEEIIAAIFAELLGAESVGIDNSFFDLGGNSLVATRAVARINAALGSSISVRDLFEATTTRELAHRAEGGQAATRRLPLVPQDRPDSIPLSLAQQRMWFINQFNPESPAYNVPMAVAMTGELDHKAVQQAVLDLLERHESLRTIFPASEDGAHQVILPTGSVRPDLAPRPADSDAELAAAVTSMATEGFDVTREIPVRAALYQRDDTHHTLVFVLHHIASDGFSLKPLATDFMRAYTSRAAGAEPDWKPLEVQYADYAIWQREYLGDENDPDSVLAEQMDYWKKALAGTPDLLELPTDRPRPAVQSLRGADHAFTVPADIHKRLRALAHDNGATLFMVIHAALAALLARLADTDDVTIGTPVAGRGEAALDELIGMFVNTLVLRTAVHDDEPFTALLERARTTDIGAFSQADVPFEGLVESLKPQRSTAHAPRFQVMLEFQNLGEAHVRLPWLDIAVQPLGTSTAKFDMQVILAEKFEDDGSPAALEATITYATDLFLPASIARLAEQFRGFLGSIAASPATPLGAIALTTSTERDHLVRVLNDTAAPVAGATLVEKFAAHVARTPDAVAIEFDGTTLTYRELDERSNQLARHLITLGAGPDTHVALAMRRSVELLVGMYAIIKAGAAYVPLDPDNPAGRNDYVLGLAAPIGAIVVDAADLPEGSTVPAIILGGISLEDYPASTITDADRTHPLRADNPAYVIFTSGSTGKPKGVSVPHRGIVNRLAWMQHEYQLSASDTVLQKTPYTFDVSVWEFFWPLQVGARLLIAKPDGHRDPGYLADLIGGSGVTVLHFVPSMLATFASSLGADQRDQLATLRAVFCSGEALPPAVVADFRALSDARIHNLYGPTEASVDVTYHEYTDSDTVSVPIGAPVWNTQVYVLDRTLRPTPVGIPGELYLAGTQLARGYVQRGDLTADRFVASPYGDPGSRMYRTGDLVRWRASADGTTELDYIGRTDFQVKLRGLRIELPEIESVLLADAAVAQAVVIVHRDEHTGDRLIAYLVAAPGRSIDTDGLLEHAAKELPAYMVPAQVVTLDAFPLGGTGKLDRKALPVPDFVAASAEHVAPRNAIEEVIASIFADLLGTDRVSVHDSFFDIGGNSLIAARLIARVNNALDASIGVRDLFDAPTVATLAVRAESALGRERPPLDSVERPSPVPLSLAQQRMWFINQLDKGSAAYNSPMPVRLTGPLDITALEQALRDVVERHETLRTRYPEGIDGATQDILGTDDVAIPLAPEDVDGETGLHQQAAKFAFTGFDVASEVPLRARLFRLAPEEHVLLVVIHHISSDGFSLAPLARDVVVAYTARARGLAPEWPPLPVQYADFAVWQRQVLGDENNPASLLNEQLAYWRNTLAGLPDVLELPTDRPRPPKQSLRGAVEEFDISAELHQRLLELARAHNASVFMVMHAAIALLLAKLSGTQDIAVGTPIAGRGEAELDDIVGMFVNTLVLRTEVDLDATFVDLIHKARAADLGAFGRADVPFERVVDALSPQRSEAHSPLFQVMLEFQNNEKPRLDLPGLSVEAVDIPIDIANFDLQFILSERYEAGPSGITAGLRYATDLFDASTVRGFARRLLLLLDNATARPTAPVSHIDILDADERAEITSINGGPGNRAEGLPDLLTMGIRDHDAPAVIDGDRHITYRELDELSNRIARVLIEEGVTTESFVALGYARSIEWLVSLWSVTKAGGAFVPVDPTYPRDRIEHMLTDSGAVAGLSVEANHASLPPLVPWMFLDDPAFQERLARTSAAPITDADRNAPILLETSAYLIYTSGSTGKPKGVVISHRGLDNFTPAMVAHPSVTQHSRVLSFASPSFDASLLEVLMAFGAGAAIVIVPPHVYGGDELTAVIRDHRVTHGFITPLGLASVDRSQVDHFEFVVVGGEAVPPELVNEWAHGRKMYNGYGPTEATIVATLSDAMHPGEPVRIGRLFNGVTAVVLDTRLQPVPKGVAGELYISGLGLGRGYHERFELTANRFVANPYGEPGERMYRTGDVVRWVDDYQLESLGRSDFQVKVRGFRIELGEIDSALLSHPSIDFAVTLGRTSPSGATALVSYVRAATGHAVDTAALTEHVAGFLPAYMVPSVIMVIEEIPLAVTGKLDRKALPDPDFTLAATEYRAPTNPIEETVAGIFTEVLGIDRISIDDNFFDAGGNSLIATRVVARANAALGTRIGVRELFDTPTVAGLAAVIAERASDTTDRPALVPQPRPERIPLSSAQQRMWFINQFDTESAAYNVPMAIRLSGTLDLPLLNTAIRDVIARHESLRTVFPSLDGVPAQVILPPREVGIDLAPIDTVPGELIADIEAFVGQGFDVTTAVPIRARLLRLAADEHVLVIVVHHISADGFSMAPLATDVMVAYHSRMHGDEPAWKPLDVQYADFALWQRDLLGEESDPSSVLARQLDYWKQALAGLPDVVDLPADRPRPVNASLRGGLVRFPIDAGTHQALAELARAHGATMFMVMHAALAVLVSRRSGEDDLAIGTPVAGRGEEALDGVVGMFVNTLVLRTEIDQNAPFADLLTEVKDTDLAAFTNTDVAFERLVEILRPDRSTSHSPLFQVLIEFQNNPEARLELPGLTIEPVMFEDHISKFDLQLSLRESITEDGAHAGIDAGLIYATDLFDQDTVEMFAQRFQGILAEIVGDPAVPVGDIALLSDTEQHAMLTAWNHPGTIVPERTLADAFASAAARFPERIAAVSEIDGQRTELTYQDLDQRSNQLARRLIAAGARPEALVGVAVPRDASLIIALLAVIKSGAAYLPVDTTYPADRLEFMLTDGAPVAIITTSTDQHLLPATGSELLLLDEEAPEHSSEPITDRDRIAPLRWDNTAYVIYTSGSTGKPKGVAVPHRTVLTLFANTQASFGFDENDVWTMFHSYAFDFSVWELWGPMLHGGTLVVVDYFTARSPEQFHALLRRERVSVLNQTPSAFYQLAEIDRQAGTSDDLALRSIIFGGEALDLAQLDRWYARHADDAPRLVNMYGITETTVHVTYLELDREFAASAAASVIGQALPGLRVSVLDARLRPVPPGTIGEMYVSGPQLSRGYLGRPDLTAGRFVADPNGEPGTLMYRSGDLARWNKNGQLEYLGRSDFQVQLRGFRIELGEIEAALLRYPGIAQSAVLLRADNGPGSERLVGYVLPEAGQQPEPQAILDALADTLAAHMLPAAVLVVDEFPLTANGKLDRRALPAPDFAALVTEGRAPSTPVEEKLAEVFAQVLGLDSVGVDDSFFALGGDSIMSIQLVTRAKAAGIQLRPRDVFNLRTVAALASAAVLTEDEEAVTLTELPGGGVGPMPLTPIMEWMLERGGAYNRYSQCALLTLPPSIDREGIAATLQAVIDHHDLLRARLDGHELIVSEPGTIHAEDLIDQVTVDAEPGSDAFTEAAEAALDAAADKLDPDHGVMLRAAWIEPRSGSAGRIVLAIHHLAVDGVTWRFLVPDLATAWNQIANGQPIQLDASTTSFRRWAHGLAENAPARHDELDTWRQFLGGTEPHLGSRAFDPAIDTNATVERIDVSVPTTVTDALLTRVPEAFHGGVNDGLLAALVLALARWRGATTPLVGLEGHGREENAVPGADLGRTLGWFTTIIPIRLDATGIDLDDAFAGGAATGALIKNVKELLRSLPDNGIGFGQLRYLAAETADELRPISRPQVSFNYLGRFTTGELTDELRALGWLPVGDNEDTTNLAARQNDDMAAMAVLDINTVTEATADGPVLRGTIGFPTGLLTEEEAREFGALWVEALTAIAHHVSRAGAGGFTPTDLDLVRIDQGSIDRLEKQYPSLADVWPLSPLQSGLLFHAVLAEQTVDAYMVQLVLHLRGVVDQDRMRRTVQALLDRHANLRVAYASDNAGQAVQLVPDDVEAPFAMVDLSTAEDQEAALTELLRADHQRQFHMGTAPLIRFMLVDLGAGEYRFVITNHHILLDGWSTPLLLTDLIGLYILDADPSALPPVRSYRDYLAFVSATDPRESLAAWVEAFAGVEEPTTIVPLDRSRQHDAGSRETIVDFTEGETERFTALARDLGVTLNTIVQTAWGIILGTLTSRDDVVFGTTVSGRPPQIPGIEKMIGLFINTLPVRVTLDPAESLTDLLKRVQSEQANLLDHHYVQLADIQREVGAGATFDTLAVFESYPVDTAGATEETDLGGMRIVGFDGVDAAHYPVTLVAYTDDALHLKLKYFPDLLDDTTLDGIKQRLDAVMHQLLEEPATRYAQLDVLTAAERQRYVPVSGAPGQATRTLAQLLADAAAADPQRIAIIDGDREITYRELDERSNQLARLLLSRGARPEEFVALGISRSIESILGIWAVTKAGAAYVPVDPTYPRDRIEHMLTDSGARTGLTTSNRIEALPQDVPWLVLDDARTIAEIDQYPASPIRADELHGTVHLDSAAYVIYTSGSTGTPKGVLATHRGLGNFATVAREHFRTGPEARVMHFSSPSFDASVLELLHAFGSAATMVIVPPETYGGEELAHILARKNVTHGFITPLALGSMDPAALPGLQDISVGGEAVPSALVEDWAPGRRLYNGYGPTETTIMVLIGRPMRAEGPVRLGGPIRGTDAVVLDARLKPVPVGAAGELYVTGLGLARGYHERRGLTAERFIANPYGEPGTRLYRTGDVVRWAPGDDGTLELDYVGRSDFQVKVRGFRIELGEIDAVLGNHPAVNVAITVGHTRPNGQTMLVSYVSPREGATIDTAALTVHLGESLPSHMVPSLIIPVDAMPRTPVGKIDRKALPEPDLTSLEIEYVAPRNVIEEAIAGVFADVLAEDRVSVLANFFDLGGNSLIATRVIARVNDALGTTLGVRELFDAPTVEALALRAEHAASPELAAVPLEPRERPAHVPVSLAQQRMWFINQFDTTSPAYNVPLAVRLTGELDVDGFTQSLRDVIDRHEALRTVFPRTDDGPSQVILPAEDVVNGLVPQDMPSEAVLRDRIIRIAGQGFDVQAEVPLRARLFRLSPTEHVLLVVVHHISADGFSMMPLARDIMVAYHARRAGAEPGWKPLDVQYADYTLWQREVLGDDTDPGSLAGRQIEFWKRTLAGVPDVLELPTDRPRPAQQTLRGADTRFTIPAALHSSVDALAKRNGATTFMVLHSALAVLLARLSGSEDIPIGTPVAGRGAAKLDDLVGMFVNTLVLRTHVPGSASFADVLATTKDTDLAAFSHADVPFERLVEVLKPERSTAHSPLFQATIEFQNIGAPGMDLDGVRVEPLDFPTVVAKYDLELILSGDGSGQGDLEAAFTYATDLFDAGTVRQLADRFLRILEQAVLDPARPIGDLEILDTTEQERFVPVHGPAGLEPALLPEILARAAARDPGNTGLELGDASLTYQELDEQSTRLARHLIALGAGPEKVVALGMARSLESVLSVWAVAKTGAAFVPVDPSYPADRIEHMLTDSAAVAGITVAAHRAALPGLVQWVELDDPATRDRIAALAATPITNDDRRQALRVHNPAYLIYTSGSTGTPKGVAVTHAGLASLAAEEHDHLGVEPGSRVLHSASPSFDASVFEMLMAYGSAATLVVAPPSVYGGSDMAELLRSKRISHAFFTPAVLASVEDDGVDDLRSILVAGDVCPPELVARWAPGRAMVNAYGPTETTIMSSITAPMKAGEPVTIGATTRGFTAMVLDGRLQPVPPGVAGELYLSGPALARGYEGRARLISERFVASPFGAPGDRMYRTGDVVRWTDRATEPELEFVGRSDFQVKIRGLRIELGEIDTALASHSKVSFATTTGYQRETGDTILVSYVRLHDGDTATPEELSAYISEFLPGYMVPSVIVLLDEVPLTPVGKLDRKALPAPDLETFRKEYVAPRNDDERIVAEVFASILGVEQVSVHDSFFDLGGNSLSVTQVVSALEKETGRALRLQAVFLNPTPAGLAERLQRPDEAPSELAGQLLAPVIRLRPHGRREPLFCVHPGVGLSWAYTALTAHIPEDRPVFGLQLPSLTGARPAESISELAAEYVRHVRDVQPQGPYHLLGWSLGGVIAQEMAVQLRAAGEDVATVALLDSFVVTDTEVPTMAELVGSFGGIEGVSEDLDYEDAARLVDEGLGQPTGLTATHMERIHRGFEDAARIMAIHEPSVLDADVQFFAARGTTDPSGTLRTADEWRPLTSGTLDIHDVPVKHQQMVEPDAIAVIGPILARHLDDH
nr:non-ribosomal peptide synthase/polyketide synthase [Lolliginicoccus lacisalsi]